jgi:uncharacterized protein
LILLRVVLDINLLISAYLFGGVPRAVFNLALEKRYLILHTPEICADLKRVLNYDKFKKRLALVSITPEMFYETFVDLGEAVRPAPVTSGIVRDEDDAIILACAVGGNADYIVTGDQDLLTLDSYSGIPILTPAEFLARHSKDSDT